MMKKLFSSAWQSHQRLSCVSMRVNLVISCVNVVLANLLSLSVM